MDVEAHEFWKKHESEIKEIVINLKTKYPQVTFSDVVGAFLDVLSSYELDKPWRR